MNPIGLLRAFAIVLILTLVLSAAFPLPVSADEPTPPPATDVPTTEPTLEPTLESTLEPTAVEQTAEPTLEPTATLEPTPTLEPSPTEAASPTLEPSATLEPTATATLEPAPTDVPASPTAEEASGDEPRRESTAEVIPTAVPEEELPAVISDVVQTAADGSIALADMTGQPLNMGTQDAAQAIAEGDPYFTSGGTLYSFTFGDCDPVAAGAQPCGNPIQAALDFSVTNPPDLILAPDGQVRRTIFVEPGTYAAELTINAPDITLWGNPGSRFVAGADPSAPVLDGSSLGGITTAITINAQGFTLIGFIIQNYTTAIYEPVILGTATITISNNTIQNNVNGIIVSGTLGGPLNEIHFNVFKNNSENDLVSGPEGANNVRFLNAQRNFWGCETGPVVKYKHMVGGVWDGTWGYLDWGTQHDYGVNGDGDDPNPDCAVLYGPDKLLNHTTAGGMYAPYKIGVGPYLVSTPTPTSPTGATSTPTNMVTFTATFTATNTTTNTPTNTSTNTPTNTATFTPTNTPTGTLTNTPTNTPTDTPTNTPTNTPTDTPTNTPTQGQGQLPTNTPTLTLTATATPGRGTQPTQTPAGNPTNTPGGQGSRSTPPSSSASPAPTVAIPVTGGGTHAIAAGSAHTCAITPNGGVQCWGDNSHGQLGDGSQTGSSSPVDVSGLAGASLIVAGGDHTCALSGSDVWCWGRNDRGQVGDGSTMDRTEPVKVLSGAADITAGFDFTCAALSGGEVMCWGANDRGQLADGTTKDHLRPGSASLLSGVFKLDAGQADTCGITSTGLLRCVIAGQAQQLSGFPAPSLELAVNRFGSGALGLDTNGAPFVQSGSSFRKVAGVTGALDLDSGESHICALLGNGTVKCWGSNTHGELGDKSTQSSSSPQLVSGLTDAWQLAVGRSHACAMLRSGDPAVNNIRCWGLNDKGQLGSGDYQDSNVPVSVK